MFYVYTYVVLFELPLISARVIEDILQHYEIEFIPIY